MTETTPNHHQPMPTAIVSRPGIMQQSLRTSLAACPWIEVVASFGDGLCALNYVVAQKPALLMIDCNLLDEEVEALLSAVKGMQVNTQCLVLIRSSQREAWARASGADVVMLRDGSLKELINVLIQFQEGPT